MKQNKWFFNDGMYKQLINGYELTITDNSVFIWWCCSLNGEVIDSSYNENNPQSMSINHAKEAAEFAYLRHYTKDLVFPDFLN